MPPPPKPAKKNIQEADNEESNDSSNRSYQSAQHCETKEENSAADNRTTAMLLCVMDDREAGTRLMSRSAVSGDRQAMRDPDSPTTSSAIPCRRVANGSSSMMYNHVTSSPSKKKNDITITTAATSSSTTEQFSQVSLPHQLERGSVESTSEVAKSPLTAADEGVSITTKSPQLVSPPLNREFVEASIKAAVASVNCKNQMKQEPMDQIEEDSSTMSVDKEVSTSTKSRSRRRTPQVKPGQASGRWTHEEHQAFLEGLKVCGREWKKVASRIPTRTSAQIRSHAQKYFSKLQRDQDSAPTADAPVAASCGESAAAIPADERGSQSYRASFQHNVERILSNPHAAQREVEQTLQALRDRYRQLQQRLEQRQAQRRHQQHSRKSQIVAEEVDSGSDRKRCLDEDDRRAAYGDHSSVASSVSASMGSMSSAAIAAASRDLGNEELIALHVLGGALPRGDSSSGGSSNMHDATIEEANIAFPEEHSSAASNSATSSIASEEDVDDDPSEGSKPLKNKRKRSQG